MQSVWQPAWTLLNSDLAMEQHKKFPSIIFAIFLVVILFAIEAIIQAIFVYTYTHYDFIYPYPGIISILSNGIIISALMAFKRINYKSLLHFSGNSASSTIILSIIPILVIVFSAFVWLSILESFFISRTRPAFNAILPHWYSGSEFFILVITVCVIAPFTEEILFRGLFLRSFLKRYSLGNAIVWSAIIFSLAHLNPELLPVALIMGGFLGWIYYRTHSLWPCMIAHSAYNAIIVVTNQYFPDFLYTPFSTSILMLALIALLITIFGFYLFEIIFRPT